MQEPAPTPTAAPQAPPAPKAPTVTVTLPDGPVPLEGLPRTAQELAGLRERREILRDQLDRATNRRDQLARELNGEGQRVVSPEARTGIQQRLEVLDARIIQIERDQAMTERLLSSAPPAVLARAAAESRGQQSMVDEGEATAAAFGTFGLGVLLTLLVGRIRRWRSRRRTGRTTPATAAALADDPRIDRLAQAVDAIAEEVERIGEGQRFVTQLLAERPPVTALRGEGERR